MTRDYVEIGRLGGRPRADRHNTWSTPIHYGDGIHLTCPDQAGAHPYDTAWPTCSIHDKVRPLPVPLAEYGHPGQSGACRGCGEKVAHGKTVCAGCADGADRAWARILDRPWAWAAPHTHEPLLTAIGDLP